MTINLSIHHSNPSSKKVGDEHEIHVYATNQCDDDLSSLIDVLTRSEAWLEKTDDVNLTIKVNLKEVFLDLYDSHKIHQTGCVSFDDFEELESLRKNCQWIVEQINQIKVSL